MKTSAIRRSLDPPIPKRALDSSDAPRGPASPLRPARANVKLAEQPETALYRTVLRCGLEIKYK